MIDRYARAAPRIEPAPHGTRFIAAVMDLGVAALLGTFVGVAGLVALLASAGSAMPASEPNLAPVWAGPYQVPLAIAAVTALGYFPYCWSRFGRTAGMAALGLRLIRDGERGPVSFGRAVVRLMGLMVALAPLGLGLLWVLRDPRRRGWHDLLAGTIVVQITT